MYTSFYQAAPNWLVVEPSADLAATVEGDMELGKTSKVPVIMASIPT